MGSTIIASAPQSDVEPWQSRVPGLENGDHLDASEFLRRYEADADLKKAELIGGMVYMASPVRADRHGEPDSLIQGWLLHYAAATPGVRSSTNTTVKLGVEDVAQPDGLLRILPGHGGRVNPDAKGYLEGPPELLVEIAASSASYDAREKWVSYRRAGVAEYLLYRTDDAEVDWWSLEGHEYRKLEPGAEGILRSKVFPGLWLDVKALLSGNAAALLSTVDLGLQDPKHGLFVQRLQPDNR